MFRSISKVRHSIMSRYRGAKDPDGDPRARARDTRSQAAPATVTDTARHRDWQYRDGHAGGGGSIRRDSDSRWDSDLDHQGGAAAAGRKVSPSPRARAC